LAKKHDRLVESPDAPVYDPGSGLEAGPGVRTICNHLRTGQRHNLKANRKLKPET